MNSYAADSITIPYGVTTIEDFAFADCRNLITIKLPATVTKLEREPFNSCDNLNSIEVEGENAEICSIDGILFSKDLSTLYAYPAGKSDTAYQVPDTVKVIALGAFRGCRNLFSRITGVPSSSVISTLLRQHAVDLGSAKQSLLAILT